MIQKLKQFIFSEWMIIAIAVLIGFTTHAYNMFHYPAYFDDEGTYLSQAWSIIHQGRLAPYSYWYDHAPLGWILLAGWHSIVGGFFTFGSSVDTGRVFLLLIHCINVVLLYFIGKKLSGSKFAGFIAAVLFSISPLGITLQRMIFLDNLMMPFILGSILLLIIKKKLSYVFISGLLFGLAFLVKESTPFFGPALLIGLLLYIDRRHKLFGILGWMAIAGFTVSFYLLYALLKNEFFPSGTPLGGNEPHTSLIEIAQWQASRKGGFFLDPTSEFMFTLKQSWFVTDPLLLVAGAAAVIINLLIGIRNKYYFFASILPLSYMLYLTRGGIVNDQYVIPLIPMLALNIALGLAFIAKGVAKVPVIRPAWVGVFGFYLGVCLFFYKDSTAIYTEDQTTNQMQAVEWIKNNTGKNDLIVTDAFALVDLWQNDTRYLYRPDGSHHYWKIDYDPGVVNDVYQNDWKNFDYLLVTPKFKYDAQIGHMDVVKKLLINSEEVKKFPLVGRKEDKEAIAGNIVIANGGPVTIYKVNTKERIALDFSWNYYKLHYIHSYGQVVDPKTQSTTSEGQAYAMLRAVWQDDKETFDGVWGWTKDHMQYREDDRLISQTWAKKNGKFQITDPSTNAAADQDIALALLFAYQTWGDKRHLSEARTMINDIWRKEVKRINGNYYLVAGSDAGKSTGYLVNPSHFSPATYRIFAQVDRNNQWNYVIRDGYELLNRLTNVSETQTQLLPNWIVIAGDGGLRSAAPYIKNNADLSGSMAFRTFWRIGLDAAWFNDNDARTYLSSIKPFFENEWVEENQFDSLYSRDGREVNTLPSLEANAGILSLFTVSDIEAAKEMYTLLFERTYNYDSGYWVEKDNFASQNWAWFAAGLHTGELINLWNQNLSQVSKLK